ncbi:Wzz/FepE/Etk N-terminal domain-containing protein [Enterococcus hirae]|uniref:Wzz/FepE/Etk N-terminal domain-containing protein n=2 Tax=Enterococcus hirae TaxID=1354 RepID=UPI00137358EA|nr:Wzz/FepE/Etk N-terminal domain-containing protein [Enterococcus hirae]
MGGIKSSMLKKISYKKIYLKYLGIIILFPTIFATITIFFYNFIVNPTYQSRTDILIATNKNETQTFDTVRLNMQLVNTVSALIQNEMSEEELTNKLLDKTDTSLKVDYNENSLIISIIAQSKDKKISKQILEKINHKIKNNYNQYFNNTNFVVIKDPEIGIKVKNNAVYILSVLFGESISILVIYYLSKRNKTVNNQLDIESLELNFLGDLIKR